MTEVLPHSPDVAVVGGGPAGLNAALVLARMRRSVVVIDARAPRNAPAGGHGLLGLEGTRRASCSTAAGPRSGVAGMWAAGTVAELSAQVGIAAGAGAVARINADLLACDTARAVQRA